MEGGTKRYFMTFKINCENTKWGESLFLTGSLPELGNWNPNKSVKMTTNEKLFPLWVSPVIELLFDNFFEYKYIICSNLQVRWEDFPSNRMLASHGIEEMAKHQIEYNVELIDEKFGINKNNKIVIGFLKEKLEESKLERRNSLENDEKENKIYDSDLNKISSYTDSLVEIISKENSLKRSWKDKLSLVWDIISKKERLDKELLSVIFVYLFFINSGTIKCAEDGQHFRPNHHAGLAFSLFTLLLNNLNEENSILIRSILRNLPSFADQYMVSVPLTRIRDIAHRNDIPKDLKDEIKHTLQNKLHRSASPDDLITCENILKKITTPGTSYSKDFVNEFKIFHEEIKEFFNRLGLEKALSKISEMIPNKDEVNKMLRIKSESLEKTLDKLQQANKVRHILQEIIQNELRDVNNSKANKSLLQMASTCEIELENYSFSLISEYLERFYYNLSNITEQSYQKLIDFCLISLEGFIISNIKNEECELIREDLIHFSFGFLFEAQKEMEEHRLNLLRLKAIFERCKNLFYEITDDVNRFFQTPAVCLGKALKIDPHSIKVFCESFVRSHLIFQFSKIVSLLLGKIRDILNLPPFNIISSGISTGPFLHLDKLSQFDPEKHRLQNYILFLNESDGSDEIPKEIKGIVLSHDLPQLSHLAIRARQNKVTFISVLDENIYKYQYYKNFKPGDIVRFSAFDENVEILKDIPQEKEYIVKEEDNKSSQIKKKKSKKNKSNISISKYNSEHNSKEEDHTDDLLSKNRYTIPISIASQSSVGSKCTNSKILEQIKNGSYYTPISIGIPFSIYTSISKDILNEEDYNSVDNCNLNQLEEAASKLREKFLTKSSSNPILDDVAKEILKYLPQQVHLAIRSSSNLEDLKSSAGAGLFDSYLGIENSSSQLSEIKHNLCKVWTSLFTHRGILARRNGSIPSSQAKMAILVQEMINPDFCFVIHTQNPITRNSEELYIELAIGLGETLASANQKGSPYRVIYNKKTKSLKINNFASFSFSINEGNINKRISYKREKLSTDHSFINSIGISLGEISCYIEDYFKTPQDIEGGYFDGKIYLLQTRPQIVN
jgi:phosphoglucan,water dikinase